MAVEHLIPVFGDGPMRMPPVGPLTVIEGEPDGVQLLAEAPPGNRWGPDRLVVVLDARQTRQLYEQLQFVLDGSVIVATNRVEGY